MSDHDKDAACERKITLVELLQQKRAQQCADNERYDQEPTRITLEKSALRIVKVLRKSRKAKKL